MRAVWRLALLGGLAALALLGLARLAGRQVRSIACWAELWTYDFHAADVGPDDFEGFDNETGVEGAFIVPNVVHYIRFGQPEFSFLDFICVLAAFKRQRPEKLVFHTDVPGTWFRGEYWEKLLATPGFRDVVLVLPAKAPDNIFGQLFDSYYGKWHAGDIARLRVLRKHGGIFLDNDAYLVQSLDELRRFEMSLGWPGPPYGDYLGTQILVAHRDARFLRLWLETYRDAYVPSLWYYNAGARPTLEVLEARPELVHREKFRLGVSTDLQDDLFLRHMPEWRTRLLAAHLLARHTHGMVNKGRLVGLKYPVSFDENNILDYNVTFLDMVLDVYPDLREKARARGVLPRSYGVRTGQ